MAKKSSVADSPGEKEEIFLTGLFRAFAGAIIFSFPIFMTMEMWELGFSIPAHRLIIFIIISIPLLTGLSYLVGFEETENLADDLVDAFVAYAVGFTASAFLLYLFGVIDTSMSFYEILGKISIQAITAAIGAMYAQSELGNKDKKIEKEQEKKIARLNYWGELFLMIVGAILLAMSVAPTEEMYLISYQMSEWQIVFLALLSMGITYTFVYTVGFRGTKSHHKQTRLWIIFLRFTIVGYAIALLVSFYLLWTFGSLDGKGIYEMLQTIIVLAFPASIGVAASRLIV